MFHFYEVYESDVAFTDYYNSDEMKDFLKQVEPLAASDIGMTYVVPAHRLARITHPPSRSLAHSLTRSVCQSDESVCTR